MTEVADQLLSMETPQAEDSAAAQAMEKKAPHVIIVGAGCTGLLLAQGLKKAGISFDIFDSDASLTRTKTREWGMTIHWSRPLLESILPEELLSRFKEAQVDPSFDSSSDAGYTVPFYNGKTGEHIIAMPMANAVRVSKSKFRQLLSEDINIQFGESISSYTIDGDEITANFESGRTETGTLLVGTDGSRSAVRSIILEREAAQAQSLPVVMYNLTVCYEDAARALHIRHLHPMNTVALHPQKSLSLWTSIQDVPDPAAPETWKFQLMPTWLSDGKEHFGGAAGLEELKEIAQSLAEPWRSSILWIPEGTEIPEPSSVAYWPTSEWDNKAGLITLAGDAAHPLPPHRGQGLNHCIQDVSNLLTAIISLSPAAGATSADSGKGIEPSTKSPPSDSDPSSTSSNSTTESPATTTQASVISAYDAELVKRGSEEVENSVKNSMLVHDFEKFMESPVLKQGYARGNMRSPPPGRVWVSGRDTSVEREAERKVNNVDAVISEINGTWSASTVEEVKAVEEIKEKKKAKEQLELTLIKEYRRKVHEMSVQERLDMQIKLVREIEGLSRQVAEKSRELSEILKVL